MSDLDKIFGQKTVELLNKRGFESLYNLITYFPSSIEEIQPYSNNIFPRSGQKYLANCLLLKHEIRKGKKPFFMLNLKTETDLIQAYFFSSVRIFQAILEPGKHYQVILSYNSPFWTVEKLTQLADIPSNSGDFILGKMPIDTYLIPVYPRILELTSSKFSQFHRRLTPNMYKLDLVGLAPQELGLGDEIDLYKAHHPSKKADLDEVKAKFSILRGFLYLSVLKFVEATKHQSPAKSSKLDLDFLKKLSSNLPYSLTDSQKMTIWDILKEITFENDLK